MVQKFFCWLKKMKFNVIGSGLDALFCSQNLINMGHKVNLISPEERKWGHFKGAVQHGFFCDIGMVLLEKDFRDSKKIELTNYRDEVYQEQRPFLHEAYSILEAEVGELEKVKITCQVSDSRMIGDYFISDNLEILNLIDKHTKKNIIDSIKNFFNFEPNIKKLWHPKNKFESKFTLFETYKKIFGDLYFQQLFAKFVQGIGVSNLNLLEVSEHRRLWLPLYFPESIYYFLTNDTNYCKFELPKIDFFRPKDSSVAQMVNDFFAKLKARNHFNFEYNSPEQIRKLFNIEQDYFIFFVTPEQVDKIFPELTNGQKLIDLSSSSQDFSADLSIVHFCITKCETTSVFMQNPIDGLYRYSISNSKYSKQYSFGSFEFGNGLNNELNLKSARFIVENLGFKVHCNGEITKTRIQINKSRGLESYDQIIPKINKALGRMGKEILGSIVNKSYNSFNDNLVRGLSWSLKVHEK